MRHISWRIIAPFALLTIVFAATGTYLTTRIVGNSLEERFNNRLLDAGRAAADAVVLQERKHLEVARAASFTNGVAEATTAGDAAALSRLIGPIVANSSVDGVTVFGADGRAVLDVRRATGAQAGLDVIESPGAPTHGIVRRVLAGETDEAGDKFSGLVSEGETKSLGTAAPILHGDDVIGAVLVTTRLATLLPQMKAGAFADVTLYAGGTPLGSTFAGGGLEKDADLSLAGNQAGRDRPWKETRSIFGRDYTLLYSPFEVRGEPAGLYSVALSTDFVASVGSTAAWQMALMFGIGTIVVFGIGWTVARSLTEPLFQLLRTARRVTQGDLTARSGLVKDDEIGALASAFDAMTQKLQKQHLSTIRALTSAIDARDPYTLGHSVRVAQLSVELGRSLGLPKPTLQHIEVGGYLHDIGKIGIRDAVLLKPGALTKEQRTIIEDHPRIGLRILEAVDLAPEVLEFVGSHHERLDGSGYPLGLRDADLPAIPRIGAVADVYDAITTDRPYRKAMTIEEALALLRREAASGLLDTRVVETLAAIASMWQERLRDDPSLRGFDPMELMAA